MALPTSIRLDPKIKKALERAAADDSRSVNNLIEKVLGDWLKQKGYLDK